jgi:phospholipid/cholesterol/gamma-HCH transport system permease protein
MSPDQFISTVTGWPGRQLIQRFLYVVDLTSFGMLAVRDWALKARLFDTRSYSTIVSQIIFTGVDALPTITFLGLLTGFLFTFRLIGILDSVGGASDLVDILAAVIGLEIGPLLAAFILISRTGSAIVVDIGNMKLHGEIEGLENLGININDYLVAPRLIGAAISQLAITVYFTFITLVFGIILSGVFLSSAHFEFLTTLESAFDFQIVGAFVVKNLLFGYIIATTACYHGLSVHSSATEVPQQTQRAIVNSLVIIFIVDGLMGIALLT